MTSAFIWCIYCLCRQKIMKFQNFVVSKLKFFVIKLGTFSRLVWKYYETYGCFQRLCGCLKISAFIWDHFWLIQVTNTHSMAHYCMPNWTGLRAQILGHQNCSAYYIVVYWALKIWDLAESNQREQSECSVYLQTGIRTCLRPKILGNQNCSAYLCTELWISNI